MTEITTKTVKLLSVLEKNTLHPPLQLATNSSHLGSYTTTLLDADGISQLEG